jgi:hypothetical protein
VEEKRDVIETGHMARDERAGLAAWAGFARTYLRVKTRETGSINSVSGSRTQIAGACYRLLCLRESHGLPGDSGR